MYFVGRSRKFPVNLDISDTINSKKTKLIAIKIVLIIVGSIFFFSPIVTLVSLCLWIFMKVEKKVINEIPKTRMLFLMNLKSKISSMFPKIFSIKALKDYKDKGNTYNNT